jgi:DNA transformation protein
VAVSGQFSTFLLDTLGTVCPVTARRMFGGVGFYAEGLFFAIADDDVLYFRVDDASRGFFEREGLQAFCPMGRGTQSMSYYSVPARLYDDPEELAVWMRRALDAARTKARARRAGRRGRAARG